MDVVRPIPLFSQRGHRLTSSPPAGYYSVSAALSIVFRLDNSTAHAPQARGRLGKTSNNACLLLFRGIDGKRERQLMIVDLRSKKSPRRRRSILRRCRHSTIAKTITSKARLNQTHHITSHHRETDDTPDTQTQKRKRYRRFCAVFFINIGWGQADYRL